MSDVGWWIYDRAYDQVSRVFSQLDLSNPYSVLPFVVSLFALYATFLSFLSTARFAIRTTWFLTKWGIIVSTLVACVGLWNDDPSTKQALGSVYRGASSLGHQAFSALSSSTGSTSTNSRGSKRRSGTTRNKKKRTYDPYSSFQDPLSGTTSDNGRGSDLGGLVKQFVDRAMRKYDQEEAAAPRSTRGSSTGTTARRRTRQQQEQRDWSGAAWSAMRGDWRGAFDQVVQQ